MEDFNNDNQDMNNNEQDNSNSSSFSIPDEYKDKGWAKTFADKTGDELKGEFFKSYDNAQNLISKRVEDYLKDTDLTKLSNYEDIKKALAPQLNSVPEKIEDYNLNELLENDKGEIEFSYSDDVLNGFSNEFKNLGLTKEQGQGIVKYFTDFEMKNFEKYANPDELQKSLGDMFPKDEDRKKCESLINEFISKDDADFLRNSAPNQTLLMFYKVAKGLTDKYDYKEGNSANSGQSYMARTPAEKNAEYENVYKELMALDNRPHSSEEKEALLKRLNSIY